ncbi:AraC-like DNA-binding protein [Bacillus ectoiniformans]|uniref:helix-turn-helix transcriptional regulator n=1 Tax=Bacillus ectoiniformans TaxID=1494429 RepID=UPI00195B8429|nr:AraC family transcriptional regulator [Bacillus ectoiniformans]MBM7647357.1 AraC-like DNA-binding protein [Bacillus ectoiniformans]
MKYTICLSGIKDIDQEPLKRWVEENYHERFRILTNEFSDNPIHVRVFQIRDIYDWVKLSRMKKHYNCYYIVILDQHLLHTSPLAVRLQVQSLIINPFKKSAFFREMGIALKTLDQQQIALIQFEGKKIISVHKPKAMVNESMEVYMLRRLLHGDVHSENEILEALSIFKENDFPNTVCYVQGFVHLDHDPLESNRSVQFICSYFEKEFKDIVPRLYFIPFRKSLLVLFRQTENLHSISKWEEGRAIFEKIVSTLLEKHRIQLYIGVGSLNNNPHMLHHSFKESKIARSLPPYHEVSLRYYEEISKEPSIIKSTRYIEDHFSEEVTAKDVANHVNLSYSHFVRLFKKETGNTFSNYLTFVRLRKGVWNLRYTDKTIEEISDLVGFNTPNYFSSTFKKYVGSTPSEFRLTKEILFT